MITTNRIRLLIASCALGALVALPAAGLASQQSTATKPARIPASGSAIIVAGKIHLDTVVSPLVLQDTGTVTGTPFGSGTTTQLYTLHPKTGIAETQIEIDTASGTVTAIAYSNYTTNTATISFSGVGKITGGTGAYAGITSGVLEFQALHALTGKREAFALVGSTATPAAGLHHSLLAALANGTKPSGAAIKAAALKASGKTHTSGHPSTNVFADTGTLVGAPFGKATVNSTDTFNPVTMTAETAFTITAPGGSITGLVVSPYTSASGVLTFAGKGMITAATGDYAKLTNRLVTYAATYKGALGTVRYTSSSKPASRAQTLATVQAFVTSIGAPMPAAFS